MIRIIYFGHSTTTDNEGGLSTGWAPGELSKMGIKQAKELGKSIDKKQFDVVFSSDLKRAIDSAKLVFGSKRKIIQDKRLRECNYGDYTGNPAEEFKDKEKMIQHVDEPFPNGESYNDVEKRIYDFLEFLKKNYNEKTIAVFSHGAPQLALNVLLKNKTWPQTIKEYQTEKHGILNPGWEYILE